MYIYKTTNIVTNKIYIGKTIKDSNKSIGYLGSGKIIKKSIKKHGKENFIKEILEDNIKDHDYLCEREIYWINYFDSTNPDIGYNLVQGGKGTLGYKMSEDTKKLIGDSHKGKYIGENNPFFGKRHTDETKEKISIANSGENNPHFGKKYTEEEKEVMSDRQKGEKSWWYKRERSDEYKNKMSQSTLFKRNGKKKYLGTHYDNRLKKWRLEFANSNRVRVYMGVFKYEIEAALAWNECALYEYGWKVKDKLNIISNEEIERLWELE